MARFLSAARTKKGLEMAAAVVCHRLGWWFLVVTVFTSIALGDEVPKPQRSGDLAEYDALISQADRDHWSFRPLRRPAIPGVPATTSNDGSARQWPRNPIDSFVWAKLEKRGWRPSPAAEPRQLLRRVYLDITGLPPTLSEQAHFLADVSRYGLDAATDHLVDELLSRPAYGERWARHWLDLVRYAESNGYERDATKPNVWRYRDYVIQSLNSDKPYDRFVVEQIAGDEIEDADAETLIATGFHRLGHWDDEPADPKEDRFDQLDDIVSTTAQVFLGLSIGCARCHNHKFEPLTMHDYYRMVAIFNPLERPRNGRTELDLPAGTPAQIEAEKERDRRIAEITNQIAQLRSDARQKHLDSGQSKLPADAIVAYWTEPARRSAAQTKLVQDFAKQLDEESAGATPDFAKLAIAELERRICELRARTPDLPRAYFMREIASAPPATHLLLRGKATRPGPDVAPGLPAVLTVAQPAFSPGQQSSRRRLTLARWIASPENPLTARVIVNRVWQHHFGEGIVRSANDFGVAGTKPSHPELLDWLAHWFVHDAEWSLKKLHRLILTSNAYRMGKQGFNASDPENEWLSRQNYQRLEVEVMRDSILAASGQLNRRMFGPSMYPEVPAEALEGHSDPAKIWKPLDESDASRRTIYAFIKRSFVVPMLEVLDLCDTTRSSAKRQVTTVAPQALSLFNGEFVNRQARYFAARLELAAPGDTAQQIDLAFQLALSRMPTESEARALRAFVDQEIAQLGMESNSDPHDGATEQHYRRAMEQVCRTIFNLNEFAYSD